ncbi:MAG: leucyl/phenylalanyl-tRNA--protein transferase [Pseudobdellovibrionaceae bacterium]
MKDDVYQFPDPLSASRPALTEDIVAVGGNLSVGTLKNAYSQGIFPWPHEGQPLLWFFPTQRGVIFKSNFREPRSLKKWIKNKNYLMKWNQHFAEVIAECQRQPRKGQAGTWITKEMMASYIGFHKAGFAKCLTVHRASDSALIGGIYGVFCHGSFSAESMFFKESNASKVALKYLCDFLFHAGLDFVDVQMVTETSEQFGVTYVSAKDYQNRLRKNPNAKLDLEKAWNQYLLEQK